MLPEPNFLATAWRDGPINDRWGTRGADSCSTATFAHPDPTVSPLIEIEIGEIGTGS